MENDKKKVKSMKVGTIMDKRNLEKKFEEFNGWLIGEMIEVSSEARPIFGEKKINCGRTEYILKCLKKKRHRLARAFREFAAVGVELGYEDAVYDELLRLLKIEANADKDFDYKTMDLEEEVEQLLASCTQESGIENPPMNQETGEVLTEIQRMKHLLDIMDRHRKGRLSEGDITELKENRENWNKDIEALRKMIDGLNI